MNDPDYKALEARILELEETLDNLGKAVAMMNQGNYHIISATRIILARVQELEQNATRED